MKRRHGIGLILLVCSFSIIGIVHGLFFAEDAPFPLLGSERAEVDTLAMRQKYAEYQEFQSRLRQSDSLESQRRRSRSREESVAVVLTPFDPNTADSLTFRRLGLPSWMASNILKYRRAGGKFRQPDDFRKIYGMDDARFDALRPYIDINLPDERPEKAEEDAGVWLPKDTLQRGYVRQPKFEPGTVVDLNHTDTAELKYIPGVGSATAGAIIAYRERLGGYHHLGQLTEIGLDTARLSAWLTIDTTALRRINLNRASVARMRQHPYINFYQAKAIYEERRCHGPIKNLKIFTLLDEFPAEDIERMEPYVCFGDD